MENNKNEERLDRMEISIKNLEKGMVMVQESIASIPGMIAKAIEELALMTAKGFKEVHEKIDTYRKETNVRFDRIELLNGIRDDLRL